MSSKTVSDISSVSVSTENNYSTIICRKKKANSNTTKFATLTKRKPAKLERLTSSRKREWLESGLEHGFIRLYAPVGPRSLIYPVTLRTTVQDICSILGFESLYLQIGGSRISNLTAGTCPLQLQNQILSNIGYETQAECMDIGDAAHLTHIFCFFIGRPEQSGATNEILIAWCHVRKGRLLQKWIKRRCTLYNGTIRIEHEDSDDEILLLSRYRVDVTEGSRGKHLRLTDSTNIYSLHFAAIGEMNLWLTRLLQTQMAPACDLSDHRLLLLPVELFSVGVNRQIITLNLRRNSLQFRPSNQIRNPLLGWLDDVGRLHSLRSLNIADNSLYHFPNAATHLSNLTELILSGNRISYIPAQIAELINLTVLNISNNWLQTLPEELSRCVMLSRLDLSFNRFNQIPDVLFTLKRIIHLEMAGNEIGISALHSLSCIHAQKIDLRRNALTSTIRLTSFICCALTELDIRDNKNLFELDLKLSQVIIMPIPVHLVVFSISFNRLTSLPEWLTDLPNIETICAHHNLILYLPYRIFMNVSRLKNLYVHNNKIERLPDAIENCSLEILSLHSNCIDVLPNELLKAANKLRNLNVSHNRLKTLPTANTMLDLNRLQFLRAARNFLDESVINVVISCRRLRLLDLSYNQLKFFDDSCLSRLVALEEVNLSGNHLTSISIAFPQLPNLQVLRMHSNCITTIPDFSHSPQLFLLDISNNGFGNLDANLCMAKTLKHLDLTCNYMLRVDTDNIKPKKQGQTVSVVNVGSECNCGTFHVGFSESAGQRNKLCIRQIRPNPNMQAVFGIVDGGNNDQIAAVVIEKLNEFLQKQASNAKLEKDTRIQQVLINEHNLKMALVYAHEHLGQIGERLGAAAMLAQIEEQRLLYAAAGGIRAVLCRSGNALQLPNQPVTITPEDYSQIRVGNAILSKENLIDGICLSASSLGFSFLYPAVLPKTYQNTVRLTGADEFIVISSRALWRYISPQDAVDSIRTIYNPQIAAKKLQDMVQTFEYGGNVSIIVIRLKRTSEDCCNRNTDSEELETKIGPNDPKSGVNVLRNIEERLEQISEAINKIDDDSNNNCSLSSGLQLWNRRESFSTVELMPNKIDSNCPSSSTESKYSTSRGVSPSNAPPDPHSDQISTERLSIRKRIDMYDRLSAAAIADSKERFQRARTTLSEQLQLRTPEGNIMKLYNFRSASKRGRHTENLAYIEGRVGCMVLGEENEPSEMSQVLLGMLEVGRERDASHVAECQ
uniref:PPM-type phosphatase domain-containing protein n=1 Tax=Setaria digitata TaxID=48799 RepID=A0A915PXJ7_9BILA